MSKNRNPFKLIRELDEYTDDLSDRINEVYRATIGIIVIVIILIGFGMYFINSWKERILEDYRNMYSRTSDAYSELNKSKVDISRIMENVHELMKKHDSLVGFDALKFTESGRCESQHYSHKYFMNGYNIRVLSDNSRSLSEKHYAADAFSPEGRLISSISGDRKTIEDFMKRIQDLKSEKDHIFRIN